MPDLNLNIRTLGSKEAIKGVKDVNSVVKDMANLLKHSTFGEMNVKQVGKADKLLKQFNTTQQQTIKLAKEYGTQVNALNKALQQTESIHGKSKQGREKIKSLTEERDRAQFVARSLRGSVNRGSGVAGELEQSRATSGVPDGTGGLGGFSRGVSSGLGMKGMFTTAALGTLVGKAVSSAISTSNKNLAAIVGIAGTARGNVKEILEEALGSGNNAGFSMAFGDESITQQARMFGGDAKQRVLDTMMEQQATGAAVSKKSIINTMAMEGLGASATSTNALLASAVAGKGALATTGKNAIPADKLVNFERIMAQAVTQGMSKVRSGEFVDGINKMVQLTEQTTGDVDVNKIADMVAAAGRAGTSAWQGARGAENLASLQSALLNPGGGVAGKMLALEAGGFGTETGSVLEAQKNLEGGLSGPIVGRLFGRLAGKPGGAAALHQLSNKSISLTNAEGILNHAFVTGGGKSFSFPELMEPGNDRVRNSIMRGETTKGDKELLSMFRDEIDKVGKLARADLTKHQMVDILMDPLVSIVNATQAWAFGRGTAEEPWFTQNSDSEMIRNTDKGKNKPKMTKQGADKERAKQTGKPAGYDPTKRQK